MPQDCRSFFSVIMQYDNAGDALICREMIRLAAANGPITLDMSRCPQSFARTIGLDAIPGVRQINGLPALILAIARARLAGERAYYFMSPGAYFGEVTLRRLPGKLAFLLIQAFTWVIGAKICHVGVSYERIGPRHAWFLRQRARLMHRTMLRDEKSAAYLRGLGVKVDGTLPDLSFNIFTDAPTPRPVVRRIALSLRSDQYPGQAEDVERFLRALPAAVAAVAPGEIDYVIVGQVERDLDGAARFAGALGAASGRTVEVLRCFDDISRCEEIYAGCDAIIANRLHALMLGVRSPGRLVGCVSGAHNGKIEGLFQSLGLGDRLLRLDAPFGPDAAAAVAAGLTRTFDGRALRATLVDGFADLYA